MHIDPQLILQNIADIPPDIRPWVEYQHSLTGRLKEHTGEATLQVLTHHWLHSTQWEYDRLHLSNNTSVLSREILMWAKNKPCWYARTWIPKLTYHRHGEFFDRLKQESLGDLIFNNTNVKRKNFIPYAISTQCTEYQWVLHYMPIKDDKLWARLSEFSIEQTGSFFLLEIFLPDLLCVLNEN